MWCLAGAVVHILAWGQSDPGGVPELWATCLRIRQVELAARRSAQIPNHKNTCPLGESVVGHRGSEADARPALALVLPAQHAADEESEEAAEGQEA